MKFKRNILNFKRSISTFLISVLCLSFLVTPLTAHAGGADDIALKAATAFVNSMSEDKAGGMGAIQNGIKFNRTGYLCYLLTKDGAIVPGCDAVALQSPGYCGIDGAIWMCFSRKGHSVAGWSGSVDSYWAKCPWIEGGMSNEPSIKAWMIAKGPKGAPNAIQFVSDVWGKEAATKMGSDEYILVIETIMSLQFSSAATGGAGTPVTLDPAHEAQIADMCKDEAKAMVDGMNDGEVYMELEAEGIEGYWGTGLKARMELLKKYASSAKLKANKMILDLLDEKGIEIANRVYHGSPVIGTVPNLIAYDVWDTTVFDSYLNNVAPHAEKIAKSEAGFTAYPGSGTISNTDVANYGVAMMIVHCADLAQTTCDETQGDTPHNPPKESEGEVTIIKSYREKNPTTGTYIDKGTYHLNKLGSNITIENELSYKVVGWKTSTSGNTGISSLTWESDVPSIIGQTGTTATSVTLPATQKYLYVLLEKNSVVAPIIQANYIIPQSTISRHISLNNPDAQLSLPKLSSHTFQWKMPDVDITECLLHKCGTTDSDCGNAEQYECDSCEHGCSDKSPTHTCSTCDSDCGKWTCKGHKCSGFTWIDNAFTLKLKNDNAADSTYDYITSTKKSAWNIVSTGKDSIDEWVLGKTRSTRPEYIESKSGLDYHTIIHRGETDIILAQWKNAAASLPANTDINTVSLTNYKVANTTDSVSRYSGRKTADYTTHFKVNIVEASPDKFTQYGATVEAPVAGGKCTKQGDFELQNPFEATASVKVEVYPGGTATPHTDINNNPQYYTSGATIYSGIMAKSGTITNFTPYVQMKYQTIYNPAVGTPSYEKAYVLSENKRSLYLNSYAEIEWDKSPNPNLTLSSLQWSTHKEAATTHPAGTVLPGGATLTLTIKSSDRQQIIVRSFQPILVGAGLTQVTNTNGTTTLATLSEVQTSHTNFVSSVANNLENLNIQQFLSTEDLATDVFTSGGKVDNGVKYKTFGGSEETKYYFNGTSETIAARQNESAQGDLDVKIGNTDYQFFTFWSDPAGNIRIQHQEVLFFCSFLFMDATNYLFIIKQLFRLIRTIIYFKHTHENNVHYRLNFATFTFSKSSGNVLCENLRVI